MPHEPVIAVRGAAEHNLRRVDIDLPRDRLIVITGLSGSGKSSLAFDTVFAEGQRKYMESLSAYARQFLDQLQKPAVESIEGLPPTIAIEQRSGSHNPRSTVATTTEIYDYLRLLFARAGQPRCWHVDEQGRTCDRPIERQAPTQIVDTLNELPEGARLMLLAPVIRGKKGHHEDVLDLLVKQGFVRARVDGQLHDLRGADAPQRIARELERYQAHTIEAVVDRVVIRPDDAEARGRMAESVELALRAGQGLLIAAVQRPGEADFTDQRFSEHYACAVHPECSLEDLEPRLFSFNSPYGACPSCNGLGTILEFDEELVILDPTQGLTRGAVDKWLSFGYGRMLRRFCRKFGLSRDTPVKDYSKAQMRALMHGTKPRDAEKLGASFEGLLPALQERWNATESESVKAALHRYLSEAPCEACHGARLKPEALHVFLESRDPQLPRLNIYQATTLTIAHARDLFDQLELGAEQRRIAEPILKEVRARLGFMMSVGLGYLSLGRMTRTLSGGEGQRIRLATQVGSGLVGCCYVLDEPTIGLHQRDNARLISTLRSLTDIGNTVLVVEHDEDTIRAADHVVDIGPGPGVHGGTVVAQGGVADLCAEPRSITGRFLAGVETIPCPAPGARRALDHRKPIHVRGARENNLRGIDVAFPTGGIVCVTGVSGSGKSTLVNQILLRAARRKLYGSKDRPGAHDRVTGLGGIDRIIEVDQSPIGRTPRSNPATYTGAFDPIRQLFTKTREAKIRGYKPGRFSFNVKGGRCEACQGQGVKLIEMHFLPDVYVQCEVCHGLRYNRETLEIHYRGKSIADVLDMTIESARAFFESHEMIGRLLAALDDVGLGYIRLGQASTTLSGGEAQRVKLATELGKRPTGHTLYVLDEPTTGLHFADIKRLLGVLGSLADRGNTIVVIEHNLDVIKSADWVLDLGPEGGDGGGALVACGTPEHVAAAASSYTGQYLRPHLRADAAAASGGANGSGRAGRKTGAAAPAGAG